MLRYIISISLFINSIISVNAQHKTDAQTVINNLQNTLKSETIQADFRLEIKQKNNVNSQSVSGNILLKSNLFHLNMGDILVWFNGITQWTLIKKNNEVSIIEPTEQELAEVNPVAILSAMRAKSNVRFSKTKTEQFYIIELLPKHKNTDIQFAEIRIQKTNNQLASMKMIQNNGNTSTIVLSNYKTGIKTTPANFQFDKTKYPKVGINDLR